MIASVARGIVRLIPILIALLTNGCTGYRDPSIAIRGASVAHSSNDAVALQFTVNLANPNDQPLNLLQFEYDVTVDGVKAYSGIRSAQATLASKSDREVSIPAVVVYDQMGWAGHDLPATARFSISGTLRYVSPGEIAHILLDTGLQRPSASFAGTGYILLESGQQSKSEKLKAKS